MYDLTRQNSRHWGSGVPPRASIGCNLAGLPSDWWLEQTRYTRGIAEGLRAW